METRDALGVLAARATHVACGVAVELTPTTVASMFDPWVFSADPPLVRAGGAAPLIDALLGTARQVAYACDVRASGAVMTAVQARVAALLSRARDGVPCTALADQLGVTKQVVSGLVARMECAALVVRAGHPFDDRCAAVMLTEHGAAELFGVARRLATFDRELRMRLGTERCARLEEALRLVVAQPWAQSQAAVELWARD